MRKIDRRKLNSNLFVGIIAVFILIVVIIFFYLINNEGPNPNFTCSTDQDCISNSDFGEDSYCSEGECLFLTGYYRYNNSDREGLFSDFFTGDFVSAQGGNVIYYNNGWVGIGTNNPKQTLNVMGSFNVTGQAFFPNSICSSGQVLSTTSTGLLICKSVSGVSGSDISGTGILNTIAFWDSEKTLSSNSNLYWDSLTNSLGIGTDSPRATFMVNAPAPTVIGRGSVGAIAEIFDTSATGSNIVYGGLAFGSLPGYDYSIGKKTVNSNTYFQIRRQDGVEFVTIDSSGNMGIGTSYPGTKLDLESGAIELNNMAAPSNPSANTARIYVEKAQFDCSSNQVRTKLQVKLADANGGISTTTLAQSACVVPPPASN
ncbi:MAG: hypothetical protein ABIH65_03305 [Nanoarchaeota archaeon]